MAAVVRSLPFELAVLQRDAEIGRNGRVGDAVDGADVELVALGVAVLLAAVGDVSVLVDGLPPLHCVVAVAGPVLGSADVPAPAGGLVAVADPRRPAQFPPVLPDGNYDELQK